MCEHDLQMDGLNMTASCQKCPLVLDIDDLLMYAERGLRAAQPSVQPTGYQTALIPCPHCGVRFVIDSDSLVASG